MITFSEFSEFIVEAPKELHPELQQVLDSSLPPTKKRNSFLQKIKKIESDGEETGLVGKKPKGSSRMVVFHKEPREIVLDGVRTQLPTITKIAHTSKNTRGSLESYIPYHFHENSSFGTMQNQHEGDSVMHKMHSVLRPITSIPDPYPQKRFHGHGFEDISEIKPFEFNRDGVLAPMIDQDTANHSWLQMGHVKDIDKNRFKALTITKEFPKGITHDEFYSAMNREHYAAKGHDIDHGHNNNRIDDIVDSHPFAQNVLSYMADSGTHPGDFFIGNLGEWKHPVTGQSHLVIRDAGGSSDILNLYLEARKRRLNAYR